ncbi:MAG: GH92 family glycosyl hydrolase [Myxococcota bacterium]
MRSISLLLLASLGLSGSAQAREPRASMQPETLPTLPKQGKPMTAHAPHAPSALLSRPSEQAQRSALKRTSTLTHKRVPQDSHAAARAQADGVDVLPWIDPRIGTGGLGWGVGSTVPGPTHPFGMAKPSPDTTYEDFDPSFAHCGGYWYADTHIRGFSHNHLVGTGASDQGNILIMPLMGIDDRKTVESGYRSPFSHDGEVVEPGYYAVTLDNGGIRAELTATPRVGVHRYTFPASNVSTLLFDLSASIPDGYVTELEFELRPDTQELVGALTNMGGLSDRYGGQRIYFSAKLSQPFNLYGVFADGKVYELQETASGERAGAWMQFTTQAGKPVEVQVGISYVSIEQAALNRMVEAEGRSFETLRAEAENAWREAFAGVQVRGGTNAQQTIFYTALYHSMMMPTLYTDVNGLYRGMDFEVHTAQNFTYYTDFSLWDTFRTLHPLLMLIAPETQGEMNTSLLKMYEQLGYIDRWPQGNGPTGCMVGDSAAMVLSESYLKGIHNFDEGLAFEALWKFASLDEPGKHRDNLGDYDTLGFIPVDTGGRSASEALEYAYNDAALASFARALGHHAEADYLENRALNYQHHFNPDTGYLQGRNRDGSFVTPFNPRYNHEYYAEGNALQWGWYAPHDIQGLINLYGGSAAFERRLDRFFGRSAQVRDTLFPDMVYWHGNEPDLHASWLYHYIGKPEKSMEWVRWVLEQKYDATPAGLDGNDDGGTLSAWYVLASLGLFPIAGTDVYLIGAPLFPEATLQLAQGVLSMQTIGVANENRYIQSVTLNGVPYNQSWITHAQLVKGGAWQVTLGPQPSTWGKSGQLPPSLSAPE